MALNPIAHAENLGERYAGSPLVRALVNLIPNVGSSIDILLVENVTKMKLRRAREFFDELARGDTALTQELIESEDFLHSFMCTARAALNSKHDEKIKMFARLLINGSQADHTTLPDEQEEVVSIIETLSYREWKALILFQSYLDRQPQGENDLQRVQGFWSDFSAELESSLAVPVAETSSFMTRIARTGLYNEITGAYWDYGGGLGLTTPRFERVRTLVEAHHDTEKTG